MSRKTVRKGDPDNHAFAPVQTRVSERAKVEISRRRNALGMSEADWLRGLIYRELGFVPGAKEGS